MSLSFKRVTAPSLAVTAAVVAVPFVAPVAANAAMGGATPITTTLRPDLRSATITNIDPVNATQTVRYVFNKDIGSTPIATQFFIGEYRQESQATTTADAADTAVRSASNTADATFSVDGDIDIEQYTYATVGAPGYPAIETGSAVTSLAQGKSNVPDSTPLIGSKSNSGTRGITARPDLIGITATNGTNTVNYIFDQKILNAATPAAQAFHFIAVNGTNDTTVDNANTAATDVTFSGNVVSVKFPAGTVGNAVRAYVDPGAVTGTSDGRSNADVQSAIRPGNGNVTNAPDLVGATVNAAGTTLSLQFDEPVNNTANLPSVVNADGTLVATTIPATGSGTGTNTLNYTITGGAAQNELFVKTSIPANVATSVATAAPNTPQGAPVGGNAGALASGYTDAPEALKVTFNNSNGVATITFDQRFSAVGPLTSFVLIDDTGSAISATPTSVSGAGNPTAGQATATVQYTPAQLTGARSLLLGPGAVVGPSGRGNVVQALTPTATASVLRKGSKAKWLRGTLRVKK